MRRLRSLLHSVGTRLRPVRSVARKILRPFAGIARDLIGLVPALVVAAGVFLIAAGLFNYLQPAEVQPTATPTSLVAVATPTATLTLTPSGSISPSSSAVTGGAVATRIVIPALKIDLPIVHSPQNEQFPLCNAAEYLTLDREYAFPGLPQATYLYAHARTNMFLPLLTTSKVNNGKAMIGMSVEVYTDDNQRHIYEITQVIRHVADKSSSLDRPLSARTDELWLQTSEGPFETSTKLQVLATPVGVLAADYASAHPAGKGNVCPDAPRCTAANQGGCRR
jgi:sortase (surface protein transpeptidase)